MTEMWRGAKKRLKRPMRAGSPTCCFRSLTRSALRCFQRRPETEEQGRKQDRTENVTASTSASGCKIDDEAKSSSSREAQRTNAGGDRCTKRSRTEPTTPPTMRKQQTFAKQLPNNAPARCPERETQRDFFGARRAASEQHVGEIQTRDEQDRARHRHQQSADERDRAVVFRCGAEAETRWLLHLQFARAFGIRRLNGGEPLRQNRQTRFRRVDCQAGTHARR